MRTLLTVASLIGFLLNVGLFVATFPGKPLLVTSARGYLEERVARELSEGFEAATGRDLSESARRLQSFLRRQAPAAEKRIEDVVRERLLEKAAPVEELVDRSVLALVERLLIYLRILLAVNAVLFGMLLLARRRSPTTHLQGRMGDVGSSTG